jgi:hypothetical protein
MKMDRTREIKSYWQGKSKNHWAFICPVCQSKRRLPMRPRPTDFHYFQLILTALFVMVLTWNWFTWKGAVSFFPLWILFEVLYRGQARLSLDCPQCGFDPSLHLIDAQRAKEEMEKYWRKKFAEKGIPFPDKPKPVASVAGEAAKKGSLTEVMRER